MQRSYDDRHISWCLTSGGENLDCLEEDAQIVISAYENGRPNPSVTTYLTSQAATTLGIWLIAAASRIEERYPEQSKEE